MTYLYILQSKRDNSYYVGISNDLEKRFNQHEKGRVKYTKSRLPVYLVYKECFCNKSLAMKREKQIKGWKSRDLIDKLINNK